MERRHQSGPGLRECQPEQPTAGQTCSRKVLAVTTPTLPHNTTEAQRSAYSDPVKHWTFRRADWKCFGLHTGRSVERLPPPDASNVEKAYQERCESLLCAAEQCILLSRRKNYVPCWDNHCESLIAPSPEPQWGLTLTKAPRPYFHSSTIRSRSDGKAVNSIDFSHSKQGVVHHQQTLKKGPLPAL